MSYQSIVFLAFCAVVLLLYYLLGRKMQRWVLAAANLVFYVSAGAEYLPFLLVTMTATFLTGRAMGRVYAKADEQLALCKTPAEKKPIRAAAQKQAKRALLWGMLITIGLLAVCKYTRFTLVNLNAVLSALGVAQLPLFQMILPVGISFYSFMALSYVLDVYWKRYPAEKNFLLYAVYLSYFPHVVQGPIDRFREFKDQIAQGVAFNSSNLAFGAQLAMWGFFKKLVIADRLAPFVNRVFASWDAFNGTYLWIAIIAYSIQIYADFSGCIDIVSGISEMFGIRLRKNFNHPYFSKTMAEFWRRWHISLQEWFKDYVYYPVSSSALLRRVKKHFNSRNQTRIAELFASCFPVLVVWLITGIWHGASWTFVAWGLFHAALLIGSQVFEPLFAKLNRIFRIDTDNFGWHFWQMVRTFVLCGIGRVFFRADNISIAFGYLKKCLTTVSIGVLWGNDISLSITPENILVALAAVLVLWAVDMLQERMPLRETLSRQNIIFRWMILFAGLFTIIIFGVYGPGYNASSFIYERF